jgi:hypothetical protein
MATARRGAPSNHAIVLVRHFDSSCAALERKRPDGLSHRVQDPMRPAHDQI